MFFTKLDKEILSFLEKQKEVGNIPVCEKNCNHCCKKVPLIASKIEIQQISKKLNTLNKMLQKEIKTNIQKLDKKYKTNEHGKLIKNVQDLEKSEFLKMSYQCPFLMGNACAIYDVRPRLCRTYFSSNKEICQTLGGTGDIQMPFSEELELYYKNEYPENYMEKDMIMGHVHRNIVYDNGKFKSII